MYNILHDYISLSIYNVRIIMNIHKHDFIFAVINNSFACLGHKESESNFWDNFENLQEFRFKRVARKAWKSEQQTTLYVNYLQQEQQLFNNIQSNIGTFNLSCPQT